MARGDLPEKEEAGRTGREKTAAVFKLPAPELAGEKPFEEVLAERRSVRDFEPEPLTVAQIGQLLWSAQGKVDGGRTTPSAGATYPLEIYAAILRDTPQLSRGVYHYDPAAHELHRTAGDQSFDDLKAAAYDQDAAVSGAVLLVIAGVYERTTDRYAEPGVGFVCMESGHAAQNVYLQAAALSLGTVALGSFDDREVARILKLPEASVPLYLMPLGIPRRTH